MAYVDRFLSVLTNGEHDNFIMKKREKQPKEEVEDKTIETIPAEVSVPIISSDQIKLEPQLTTDEHPIEAINDFDLAEKVFLNFSDITSISNGSEQSLVDHNHGVVNNNQSPYDLL